MPAELATTLTATEEQRLEQAEGLVRGYCGWHIAPLRADQQVTFDSNQRLGQTLILPSLQVTAVSSITEDGQAVDPETYAWTAAGVLTRRWREYDDLDSRCGWWTRPVVVTFTHGYASVPPEVTGVVQAIAQRAVGNPGSSIRKQAGPFADSYSLTGANQAAPLALLDAEKAILDRYKLPPGP